MGNLNAYVNCYSRMVEGPHKNIMEIFILISGPNNVYVFSFKFSSSKMA